MSLESTRKSCGHRPQCLGGSGACPPQKNFEIWAFRIAILRHLEKRNEVIKISLTQYTGIMQLGLSQVMLIFICAS